MILRFLSPPVSGKSTHDSLETQAKLEHDGNCAHREALFPLSDAIDAKKVSPNVEHHVKQPRIHSLRSTIEWVDVVYVSYFDLVFASQSWL